MPLISILDIKDTPGKPRECKGGNGSSISLPESNKDASTSDIIQSFSLRAPRNSGAICQHWLTALQGCLSHSRASGQLAFIFFAKVTSSKSSNCSLQNRCWSVNETGQSSWTSNLNRKMENNLIFNNSSHQSLKLSTQVEIQDQSIHPHMAFPFLYYSLPIRKTH